MSHYHKIEYTTPRTSPLMRAMSRLRLLSLLAVFFSFLFFFFFNDTATTEIYTLSLHDALPIYDFARTRCRPDAFACSWKIIDRKNTRLNSSHGSISYAVFCLKKKKNEAVRRRQKTGSERHCHLVAPPAA